MKNNLRKDLKLISELINSNEKVLDIGCGDGNLLSHLMKIKKVECRGIELSQTGVNECVKKGLSVRQTEFIAKRQKRDDRSQDKLKSLSAEKDPDTIDLERSLTALLRIPVTISYDRKKKSGKVHISYGSIEELDLICRILKSTK